MVVGWVGDCMQGIPVHKQALKKRCDVVTVAIDPRDGRYWAVVTVAIESDVATVMKAIFQLILVVVTVAIGLFIYKRTSAGPSTAQHIGEEQQVAMGELNDAAQAASECMSTGRRLDKGGDDDDATTEILSSVEEGAVSRSLRIPPPRSRSSSSGSQRNSGWFDRRRRNSKGSALPTEVLAREQHLPQQSGTAAASMGSTITRKPVLHTPRGYVFGPSFVPKPCHPSRAKQSDSPAEGQESPPASPVARVNPADFRQDAQTAAYSESARARSSSESEEDAIEEGEEEEEEDAEETAKEKVTEGKRR